MYNYRINFRYKTANSTSTGFTQGSLEFTHPKYISRDGAGEWKNTVKNIIQTNQAISASSILNDGFELKELGKVKTSESNKSSNSSSGGVGVGGAIGGAIGTLAGKAINNIVNPDFEDEPEMTTEEKIELKRIELENKKIEERKKEIAKAEKEAKIKNFRDSGKNFLAWKLENPVKSVLVFFIFGPIISLMIGGKTFGPGKHLLIFILVPVFVYLGLLLKDNMKSKK